MLNTVKWLCHRKKNNNMKWDCPSLPKNGGEPRKTASEWWGAWSSMIKLLGTQFSAKPIYLGSRMQSIASMIHQCENDWKWFTNVKMIENASSVHLLIWAWIEIWKQMPNWMGWLSFTASFIVGFIVWTNIIQPRLSVRSHFELDCNPSATSGLSHDPF